MGIDTRQVPSTLRAGAQPTYKSAGRGPDSGLAVGVGTAAAGEAPGRWHPSSLWPGTRAGRTAESTAPPARSAQRVHRARASPPACSSRCGRRVVAAPTRVSVGAALRRSSLGLVSVSTTNRAPGAAQAWPSSSPPAGAGSSPDRAAGMPSSRGASEGQEAPGARQAGKWHRGPRGSSRARLPCRSRCLPSALPAPSFPTDRSAGVWRTSRPLAPLGRTTYLSLSRARPCPHLRGRPPAWPWLPFFPVTHPPLPWAFFLSTFIWAFFSFPLFFS